MADIKIEFTTAALTTAVATSTQDITIASFGTVKAAMIMVTHATANNTSTTDMRACIGVADGTNVYSQMVYQADGLTSGYSGETAASDTYFVGFNDSALSFDFTVAFITDGIRLTVNTAAPSGYLATVILFGGSDLSNAHVGSDQIPGPTPGDEAYTSPGFEPDVLFSFFPTAGTSGMSGGWITRSTIDVGSHGYGCAINDGAETSRFTSLGLRVVASAAEVYATTRNDRILSQYTSTTESNSYTLKSFDASGFTITSSANPGFVWWGWLALKFTGSPDIDLFDMEWPTSGNYAETTPAFTPSVGMLWSTVGPTARNAIQNSNTAGMGVSVFDGTDIQTMSWSAEEDATTSNCNSMMTDRIRVFDYDGTDEVVSTSHSFDSSGWDFTVSTNPSTNAVLGFGLAIGDATGGGSILPQIMHNRQQQV